MELKIFYLRLNISFTRLEFLDYICIPNDKFHLFVNNNLGLAKKTSLGSHGILKT